MDALHGRGRADRLTELRTGQRFTGTHHETFAMRAEQAEAVNKTHAYFHSIWKEDMHAVPRFLWNAKMRFGKTFTAYQLAKRLGAKRVLVVTFKPAVEDAWQTDLESHVDFDGWQYLSRNSDSDPTQINRTEAGRLFRLLPGSARPRQGGQHQAEERMAAQGELGPRRLRRIPLRRVAGDRQGTVRGRGRRGRQEGEPSSSTTAGLEDVNEDFSELSEKETEFLPITTKAYLYLSGTPFRALATGEFIEEQIFNWTYTDEQRAKEEFAAKHPDQWNPYGACRRCAC